MRLAVYELRHVYEQVPQLVVDDLMADCAQLISEELPSNLVDPRKFACIPLLSLAVRNAPLLYVILTSPFVLAYKLLIVRT